MINFIICVTWAEALMNHVRCCREMDEMTNLFKAPVDHNITQLIRRQVCVCVISQAV